VHVDVSSRQYNEPSDGQFDISARSKDVGGKPQTSVALASSFALDDPVSPKLHYC